MTTWGGGGEIKVTHEKLLEYMLKTDFQPILVNFWCGNLHGGAGGGARAYILKSGGGGAVAPPSFSAYAYIHNYNNRELPFEQSVSVAPLASLAPPR